MSLFLPEHIAHQMTRFSELDQWRADKHYKTGGGRRIDDVLVQPRCSNDDATLAELDDFMHAFGVVVTPAQLAIKLDVALFRHLRTSGAVTAAELCALLNDAVPLADCERVLRARPHVFERDADGRWSIRLHPRDFARALDDPPDSLFLPPSNRVFFLAK